MNWSAKIALFILFAEYERNAGFNPDDIYAGQKIWYNEAELEEFLKNNNIPTRQPDKTLHTKE
jgi:hypothetical protein